MTITQSLMKYGIKAAGLAGAGLLLYDAHKEGRRISVIEVNRKNADAADDYFENTRNLHQPSTVNMKLKDKIFNWEITNNLRGFINGGVGYVKGFASMMLYDVLPWALSATALLAKGPSAATANAPACKGRLAKASGIGLAAYAAYAFIKNVCGFGVTHKE